MRTKENARKPVRKMNLRIVKVFTIIALTVAALIATSIIGPTRRSGKVQAFGTASVDLSALTYSDSFGTTPIQWNTGTVPGFPYNIAKYHSELSNEGVRGEVDPNVSHFNISCPDPFNICATCSNHTASPVTDDNLGNQTFAADPTNSALDHRWVQGRQILPLIYELQASSSNAVVFPANDHFQGGMYESMEFTVWGYTGAGTPNQATFPTGWVQGRLSRVYQDGWKPHVGGYAQSFDGGAGNVFNGLGFETDDFASVWSFIDPTTNQPLSVVFVAVYSNKSMTITPNLGNPFDGTNCPSDNINDGFADGNFSSNDCEIDAVATSAAITGCIDPACAPPPPPSGGCTFTQGYWKTHGPAGCATGNNTNQWPVSSLTLGTVSYSQTQLCSIMNTSPRGNGLISLAHQLIAAKLNIANGADPTAIASFITAADALIGNKVVPPIGSGSLSSSAVNALVSALTNYNEGITGPGHCN